MAHRDTGAVINGAIPVVVVLLDYMIFRRTIARASVLGVAVSFAGAALVVSHGDLAALLGGEGGYGEFLFVVAICGWAGYTILARPLLERLPVGVRGPLLHLRMQDHYVEVHTDRGSELVLLRFSDALKELGGTEGMQVHRSHWIARHALKKITRRGSRTFAHLSNGSEVPVSRSYAKSLREAQWI